MPVFEAKNLDAEFEGQALLAAILFPTQDAKDYALMRGRRRAAHVSAMAEPQTVEPHFPNRFFDPEIEAQAS